MTVEENKAWVKRMFDEYNAIKGDAAKARSWVDRNYAPDCITHAPVSGEMNFEQAKQYHVAETPALLPYYTVKNLFAEGDVVVAQLTVQGIHQGTFFGMPATGKKMQVEGTMIIKVIGSKMQELWIYLDTLGWMRQLGAIPTPAK